MQTTPRRTAPGRFSYKVIRYSIKRANPHCTQSALMSVKICSLCIKGTNINIFVNYPNNFPNVCLPAMPSALRAFLYWYSLTAASVPLPKMPSKPPEP